MDDAISEAHKKRLDAVNLAATEEAHTRAERELRAWRDGVAVALGWDAAGGGMLLMDGDLHYLDMDNPESQDRPMCGGVWLDWTPTEGGS